MPELILISRQGQKSKLVCPSPVSYIWIGTERIRPDDIQHKPLIYLSYSGKLLELLQPIVAEMQHLKITQKVFMGLQPNNVLDIAVVFQVAVNWPLLKKIASKEVRDYARQASLNNELEFLHIAHADIGSATDDPTKPLESFKAHQSFRLYIGDEENMLSNEKRCLWHTTLNEITYETINIQKIYDEP